MPEYEYEYVDEHGHPLTPEEVAALGDVEIVEETPVSETPVRAATPSTPHRIPKALIGVAAVAVLGIGGGVAYGLHAMGGQDNVAAVKAQVRDKTKEVKQKADQPADEPIDACSQLSAAAYSVTATTGASLKDRLKEKAEHEGSDPSMELAIQGTPVTLPGFAERLKANPDARVTMLQLGRHDLGIYVAEPQRSASADSTTTATAAAPWWKVVADTSATPPTLAGGPGDGTDEDAAGACETAPGGTYRVVGDGIPASAEGLKAGQVQVESAKADASQEGVVWLVIGDQFAKAQIQAATTGQEGGS
ncbi:MULTISPECIES: hypothetical protein [Gordonia]|uniref:hypothetical protein n=1 Tax=Gordonia TaxID=2053 RepID=UPI0007E9A329|nr:hypothetical protein [Gordonia sp. 852002-10350_SCH5691597]OBA73122.1 hypothetical protein A5777_10540 [Gordonia sp. 852002-10350_SCH5691597]